MQEVTVYLVLFFEQFIRKRIDNTRIDVTHIIIQRFQCRIYSDRYRSVIRLRFLRFQKLLPILFFNSEYPAERINIASVLCLLRSIVLILLIHGQRELFCKVFRRSFPQRQHILSRISVLVHFLLRNPIVGAHSCLFYRHILRRFVRYRLCLLFFRPFFQKHLPVLRDKFLAFCFHFVRDLFQFFIRYFLKLQAGVCGKHILDIPGSLFFRLKLDIRHFRVININAAQPPFPVLFHNRIVRLFRFQCFRFRRGDLFCIFAELFGEIAGNRSCKVLIPPTVVAQFSVPVQHRGIFPAKVVQIRIYSFVRRHGLSVKEIL